MHNSLASACLGRCSPGTRLGKNRPDPGRPAAPPWRGRGDRAAWPDEGRGSQRRTAQVSRVSLASSGEPVARGPLQAIEGAPARPAAHECPQQDGQEHPIEILDPWCGEAGVALSLAVNTRECAGRRASSMRPLWVLNQRRVWGQHIAPRLVGGRGLAPLALEAKRPSATNRSCCCSPSGFMERPAGRGRGRQEGQAVAIPPSITRVRVRITGSPTLAWAGLNCWRSTRLLATGSRGPCPP